MKVVLERIGLVRADSGFCSKKMMGYFEQNEVTYVITVRFHAGLGSLSPLAQG